jgi:DNA-directed RNA polymerase specialized sigma54-like protein
MRSIGPGHKSALLEDVENKVNYYDDTTFVLKTFFGSSQPQTEQEGTARQKQVDRFILNRYDYPKMVHNEW